MANITIMLLVLTGMVIGGLAGWILYGRIGKNSLKNTLEERDNVLQDASEKAESERKLALAKAREEFQKERRAFEADYQKRYEAAKNIERAMNRRDSKLRKFESDLDEKSAKLGEERDLLKKEEDSIAARRDEIDSLKEEYNTRLERVAGLGQEEAKKLLMANLKSEAEHEAVGLIRQIKEDAQKTAEIEATKIITLAIERVATDQVAQRTTTHFKLQDEGIKGRLIGHEGRNIKFFEEQTGMQLLINNDDPNTVLISGFNPVAREIASQALERLIKSGKIHPRKIQESVARARKKVMKEANQAGHEAFKKLDLKPPHPEIQKLIGRLKFRTSYGQNALKHSLEVAELSGSMAAELGFDAKLAKRAGLLHDLGKAIDVEREGTHPELGGEAARKYGEHAVVINAIESHHEDVEVIHPISILVAVADAISGSRPGARRASLADYLKRIETLEKIVDSFDGVEQSFAIQAGREVRVIVKADHLDDERLPFLSSEMAKKVQDEMDYPGRIKLTLIRDKKAVEYAG